MASVQFYGADEVLEASENFKCPCWAIFINGRLFSKHEETDLVTSMQLLCSNLELLERNSSTGIYTLKFFESQPGKPIKINEKSVCDAGSFNFKLVTNEERDERRIGYHTRINNDAQNKEIEALKRELAEMKAREEEEPETIGSVVKGLLQNPDQLGQLINIGRVLFGKAPVELPAIAGIGATEVNHSQEEQLQRLSTAIDTLEKADPNLVGHLELLADMSVKNPAQFRMLLTMLK